MGALRRAIARVIIGAPDARVSGASCLRETEGLLREKSAASPGAGGGGGPP